MTKKTAEEKMGIFDVNGASLISTIGFRLVQTKFEFENGAKINIMTKLDDWGKECHRFEITSLWDNGYFSLPQNATRGWTWADFPHTFSTEEAKTVCEEIKALSKADIKSRRGRGIYSIFSKYRFHGLYEDEGEDYEEEEEEEDEEDKAVDIVCAQILELFQKDKYLRLSTFCAKLCANNHGEITVRNFFDGMCRLIDDNKIELDPANETRYRLVL